MWKRTGPGEPTMSNVVPFPPTASFGPNTSQIHSLLIHAAGFSREEVAQLDHAEAIGHDLLLAAWDDLRDRLRAEPERAWRFAAREASWRAYDRAASRLGLECPPTDGYWRVARGAGFGAARATRYAACALVAPEKLDRETFDCLVGPWRAVVGRVGR